MTILQSGIAQAAAAAGGYQIARSLRFNSADTAYLNRTPGTAGNRKTFTISIWFKRSSFGVLSKLISAGTASGAFTSLEIPTDNTFKFLHYDGASITWYIQTTQVFRDPSGWAHLLISVDTTQATSSNRLKMYINGSQITALTSSYPTQNTDSSFNAALVHQIGNGVYNSTEPFSGYMADVRLIDGQALDPTSFGEFDANTGVWMPKTYSGTYGTNGFWLKLDDNSNNTATTLGKDSSGNSNNWTPNNFSVTAGVGNDSLVDSPTNYGTDTGAGGEVRGNYATWNRTSPSGATFTNGNLDIATVNNGVITPSTIFQSSGKWYCEVLWVSGSSPRVGITNQAGLTSGLGNTTNSWANLLDGRLYHNASVTNYGVSLAAGDVLIMALDLDAGKLWYGKNGTWMASGDPATGANPSQTFTANQEMSFAVADGGGTPAFTGNFGQRPFAYTAPSGFKALTTTNLPTPAIGATSSTLANKNFDVSLWTGNATSNRAIVTDSGFAPDFVWVKARGSAAYHSLNDRVRGVNAILQSNTTSAELVNSNGYVTAFNSNGFSISDGSDINASGVTFVGWLWKGGGTAVTNTAGTISSQVSANTTAGIAVVTYSGNGTAGATVGHGLGVAPAMVIVKSRTISPSSWRIYNKNLANAATTLDLNSTAAADGTNGSSFNSTAPTSSVFSLGTADSTNNSSATYVAYCFAEVAGFSKFGSYTGNGSADGPFVYCGFRPRYLLVKRTDSSPFNWRLTDTARSTYNQTIGMLEPSTSASEYTDSGNSDFDILSNGFKIRNTTSGLNGSGGTFIFAAFGESPFNYSRAR